MRRWLRIGAAVSTAAALTTAVALAGDDRGERNKLKAHMDAGQVVPGPGDPNGRGRLNLSVKPNKGNLCFEISWRHVHAKSAYIQKGRAGGSGAGRIYERLFVGSPESPVRNCKQVDGPPGPRRFIEQAERFYAVIYAPDYGSRVGGAIRGQLEPR
jgi:hypothetical protein